jgi:hypothetical protein
MDRAPSPIPTLEQLRRGTPWCWVVCEHCLYNGSVARKALELLGKELGMFIDRKEVGGPNEFERMSDEVWDALR